jgi:hypothetical protein
MGYFLVTTKTRNAGGAAVSYHLHNMVCANDKDRDGQGRPRWYKSMTQFRIMLCMADHARHDGTQNFYTQEQLAAECQCSVKTFYNTLREFEAQEWIKTQRTIRKMVYRILAHGAVDPKRAVALAKNGADSPATITERDRQPLPKESIFVFYHRILSSKHLSNFPIRKFSQEPSFRWFPPKRTFDAGWGCFTGRLRK